MGRKKNIFVTGAASGIGRETALLFAKKGFFVGIVDVDEGGLASLESEIGKDNCFMAVMDVTSVESVEEATDGFVGKTDGKMDVLFNNAGIASMGPNEEIPILSQHKIVDVNFKGILTGIHAALPHLKNTPGSRIISMCSASAIYGIPELAVYSATKHAVKGLTEALNIELEKHGIIVSDILVPYVKTPLVTDADVKAFSVEKMGVKVETAAVAETVWKAAHGSKVHWIMTGQLKLLLAIFWAFPFAKRSIIKAQTISPD